MECTVWCWGWYALANVMHIFEGGKALRVDIFVYAIEQGRWWGDGETQVRGWDDDAEWWPRTDGW